MRRLNFLHDEPWDDPDVVAYPEQAVAWVATRHPERPVPAGGDEGIIARFELPQTE